MKVVTASLVRAPLARLQEWVAYHRNSGIDHMYLFFDDPTDPAAAILERQPGVTCYRCDDDFWRQHPFPGSTEPARLVPDKQAAVLAYLLRDAGLTADWLAHIDTDELIWAPGGVRGALERELGPAIDHLQLPPLEAVPPRPGMTDPFREVHLFKEHLPRRYATARRLGVRRPFRGKVYLRGHRRGKAIVRVGAVRTMRVHGPPPSQGAVRSAAAPSLRVLHFDAGGFRDWLAKWENREGYGGRLAPARRKQTVRFERADRGRGRRRRRRLRRLYRREYMLTERDARVLRALGLVRVINLDPSLFASAPTGATAGESGPVP